jgi:hypothetical protein
MAQANGKTEELLKQLYHAGNSLLNDYPWEFEEDRWVELLVCSLMVGQSVASEAAREAIESLRKMDQVSVDYLSGLTPESTDFITKVFVQFGCDDQQAQNSVRLLSSIANIVKAQWDGYIQRFLRDQGERMVKDFADALKATGLTNAKARKIALVWLQNVANIPLLLSGDEYVQSFCREHKVSEQELVNTADRLGLNISVLDDLLALEALAASQAAARSVAPKKIAAKASSR